MSFTRKLAKAFGVERLAAKLFGKTAPHDGSRVEGVEYAHDPKIERIVFICGLHRSGTTLLERMLAAEYDVSYLRANVPESEGQHMQSVFPPASQFGGPGRFACSTAMHERMDELSDYPTHRDAILDDWRRFVVGNSPVLLEKSPPNLTKIAWLRKVFPNSRFVIMARDPRAVAGATQKWSKSSIPELVMHWNAAYSRALEDYDESDCVIVRYEDLVDDSEAVLEGVAQATGLTRRTHAAPLEERHRDLLNTNEKYLSDQLPLSFGRGVWREFGYDF